MATDSDVWATPPDFFQAIDEVFHFTLDVCALEFNTKVPTFFSPDDDGLKQSWSGVCWMNPPYSETGVWVEKAVREAERGCIVICLLPAFLDADWWHALVHRRADFVIPTRRLDFVRYDTQMKQRDLNGDLLQAEKSKATCRFGTAVVGFGLTERFNASAATKGGTRWSRHETHLRNADPLQDAI